MATEYSAQKKTSSKEFNDNLLIQFLRRFFRLIQSIKLNIYYTVCQCFGMFFFGEGLRSTLRLVTRPGRKFIIYFAFRIVYCSNTIKICVWYHHFHSLMIDYKNCEKPIIYLSLQKKLQSNHSSSYVKVKSRKRNVVVQFWW